MFNSSSVVTLRSPYYFDETLDRILRAIQSHGLLLFLALDQQAAAKKDGVLMHPARLLLFGRPRAGTRILIEVPEAGIDLPLKAYVWEAADGEVFVSYSNPVDIVKRHGLSEELAQPFNSIFPLLREALKKNPIENFIEKKSEISDRFSMKGV